ncbi:conserved hypothetical protein [Methanocella paludicola SANAE]|uniref:HEPN domain-containing protein n=1 Tax=Methanocella paludicola (strain DSM 17711 / JCM 13418 / NBRC 101707 / SANAE) TaxID=304371 RepID=D1YZ12_METPS|nr:HEPN domain-containing protein [Methanocella paludicola]BAI61684.1 conserved hypothetical protein [Methanocella paludicola SANAE]
MSSLAETRAVRYLLDAIFDRSLIDAAIDDNIPSLALFHMEQLCEKSTKACLATMNILITKEHTFSDYVEAVLIPDSTAFQEDFKKLLPALSDIETEYISSRYGVDSFGRVTLEEYQKNDVLRLRQASFDYMELAFKFVESKYGKKFPRNKDELLAYMKSTYDEFITKSSIKKNLK